MCHETCLCEQCARDNALKRDAAKLQDFNATLAARVADLGAENAKLRKDKARLDWLDSGGVWKMEKRFDTTYGAEWPVFFKPAFGWDEHRGNTARKSIDKAMGAQ